MPGDTLTAWQIQECRQTPEMERQQARDRLRRRLAVIVDERWPERVRFAAIQAVQASLDPRHWLNDNSAADLLETVLPQWATRPHLDRGTGRVREIMVRRPPMALLDVWRP